jgi:cytochrome bd ubiquinol oxidase subunit I
MHVLGWNRLQFGFTISYHYLFPQLTMGLALLLVVFKTLAISRGDERCNELTRFWGRVFGINFALGVVTGIPMEFQFGTNWARFSAYAGGVVGLTLALEGMFAFFAESAFLGLFLFGERRLGPRGHLLSVVMVFVGSWLSGYFIIATNAFMQHPTGYAVAGNGTLQLADLRAYLLNPWALWQYAHTMCAAVVTGAFAVAAVGAYWALMQQHEGHARLCLQVGVIAGLVGSGLLLFPTGDASGKLLAHHQRPALAAMEGKFESSARADLAIIGQPDVAQRTLVNPVYVPEVLSYLAYGSFGATVVGLDDVPEDEWPDNIELLYYAYHIMVGLGTIFMAVMLAAAVQLWRGRLAQSRPTLWALLLAFPFPYIATTAGWLVAELGRQPWLVYGLQRTRDGTSPSVPGGNVVFTMLGFMGLYLLIGLLFVYLVLREIARGPAAATAPAH